MTSFNIIVAMDADRGIGKDGKLPWYLPADLKHFKKITMKTTSSHKKNVVVMGRKTWESLPQSFRPLPGRVNLILTRNDKLKLPEGVLRANSLEAAFCLVESTRLRNQIDQIFVIGGQQIFEMALESLQCQKIYATHVDHVFECDTFFPPFKDRFKKIAFSSVKSEEGFSFSFAEYTFR